jgi:RHH-type proline utilization regulon transcriptional repressor/proline dehydrogenase/delta 1-pyrroline-5-carboxylate dehydrogenase
MAPPIPFLPVDPLLEESIRRIGLKLFSHMENAPAPALFSKKGAYGRLIEWAMEDPAFKTQLFRFVDVLPSLGSSAAIVRHLQEYLGDRAVELNPAMKAGLAAASFAPALVAGPVKANVAAMARQFVAGETPADLVRRIRENRAAGMATTIDLLGEMVVSEREAGVFLQRNLDVIDTVSRFLEGNNEPCASDVGDSGPVPGLNLSVKISALAPDIRPSDPEKAVPLLTERLRPILRRAAEAGAFINLDMESYQLKDLSLAVFRSLLAEPGPQPMLGIALQAYLRDCEADLRGLIEWGRAGKRRFGVRLVKGAYWDYETILARQRGWPVPVWSSKPQSDANFEKLSRLLLESLDVVAPAFGTHNVRSCAHAIAQAERIGVDPKALEFQALFGMADELKGALIQGGYRVREYCPVGELLPGMAYFVRRLLENTSNEGFLRLKHTGAASREDLLRNPAECVDSGPGPGVFHPVSPGTFVNAANTDFSRADSRERMYAALKTVAGGLGRRWPLVLDGRRISDRDWVPSMNPARPSQIVGYWACATVADADEAVAAARAAFPSWSATPVGERASILLRTADILEERRFELNALEVFEAAKPWAEADGDVSEAIDFCRFYAAEMIRLGRGTVTQAVPGERCFQTWIPRGVAAVIAPWNFPLAILCGMTAAAAVAGNSVVMKPAEQTSVLAAVLLEILREAGLPAGVVNYLPGRGEEVGARLVGHPGVDIVAFTGSRPVGLAIWEAAARATPGQANLKKVVCEMGGKNALIIDDDADLDEAIPAALNSAFGFSGQKCSALSRIIVLDGIHDRFVDRFVAACATVPVGDPSEPGTLVGPVIDAEAQQRILGIIERGKKEATLAFQSNLPAALAAAGGTYVPPTVFKDVAPEAFIAREEIFGPVVAILRARDLDQAFSIANGTDYALTAGLFSRSPSALARAERELLAGNLYLNRGITGAIVERHPFGGFKQSGGGTKAGGRGYLENFLFPKAVAENVLRRGFVPPDPAAGTQA